MTNVLQRNARKHAIACLYLAELEEPPYANSNEQIMFHTNWDVEYVDLLNLVQYSNF